MPHSNSYFEELITKNAAKNNANEAAAQAIELAKKVFANPPEYHFRDDGSIGRILPFTVGNGNKFAKFLFT